MTRGDYQTRIWLERYVGDQPPTGGSHWSDDTGSAPALLDMMALAEQLTGSTTTTGARQCASATFDELCRTAVAGNPQSVRAVTLLCVALATGTSFVAASDQLSWLCAHPDMPSVVVAAARLANCDIEQRWLTYVSPQADEQIDRTDERLQLIDLACRLADRGVFAVDLLILFADRFRGSAADFALHILDICARVPPGFADRLAWTLAQDWDGDPRDIPAAVEALMSAPAAA